MSSPHLKTSNPAFELKFISHLTDDKAIAQAVLSDGSKWEKVISGMKLSEIRSDFFSNVETVSDNMELEGDGGAGDDDAAAASGKGAKKGGGGGGAKPAGKK